MPRLRGHSRSERSNRPKIKLIAYVIPAGNVTRIGASGDPVYRPFLELARLGYVEGQNLGVARYSGEGQPERYAELARDVVNTFLI